MNKFFKRAKELHNEFIEIRRHIHKNAELSMKEYNTQKLIMEKLREMGIEPKECGGTGVVALIGKKEGKTILLRGDIDALPMEEHNDLEFKTITEAAHLCGHDIHTTGLLLAAKMLKEREDELQGQVKLMFQPGEETGQGALAMLKDGILENPKVDVAMALHVAADIDVGIIGFTDGIASASMDTYMVKVKGKGGHSSTPHLAIDPLVIVNTIYEQFNLLQAKETDPFKPVAIVTGKMGGGTAPNIIPDTADIQTGMRCFDIETRKRIRARMEEIIETTCKMLRGTYTTQEFHTPSIFNNKELTDFMQPFIAEITGEENCVKTDPLTGTEDFSYLSEKVPSLYIWGGARKKGTENAPLHNPNVVFDEDILLYSSSTLANCAFNWLNQE